MRSLVVFVAVLALSVAAPRDDSSLKKRSVGHTVAYTVPTQTVVAAPVVAEPVVETRAVYASPATIYSTGTAVSHQSRVDVRTSPAVVASAPAVVASAPAVVASAPAVVASAPAVVASAPAVVSTPTIVEARNVYSAPVYTVPSAVSHQSRYEVHTSPAVVSQQLTVPTVVDTRSLWTPTVYATSW